MDRLVGCVQKEEGVVIQDGWPGYNLELFNYPEHYRGDIESVLIPHGVIMNRIECLARDILEDIGHHTLMVLCVLKGGYKFCSDLVDSIKSQSRSTNRQLTTRVEFIRLKSYLVRATLANLSETPSLTLCFHSMVATLLETPTLTLYFHSLMANLSETPTVIVCFHSLTGQFIRNTYCNLILPLTNGQIRIVISIDRFNEENNNKATAHVCSFNASGGAIFKYTAVKMRAHISLPNTEQTRYSVSKK
uniref:Un-named sa821 n=1 Tax=Astyanax mexicanus TaxID=7994 RepID=A0A8B9GX03_ASTMX